jgi:predicted MFS family arabinose efflux permease
LADRDIRLQAVFLINPPLSFVAVGLLWAFAPKDQLEPRQFDVVGAAFIAAALGAFAWALSQIGRSESQSAALSMSDVGIVLFAGLGVVGVAVYALWERSSEHPMTPPRLAENRVFVGLNIATLLVYAGLSIMFFLVPFDLVDRRGLAPINAGMTFLPFTLGVGLLSRLFGSLADAIGARAMLITGPIGAALAYVWMALGQDADLMFGVICPMTLLGIAFAVLVAPLTASVMSSVEQTDEGLASGINNAASRVAQLAGVAIAAGVGSLMSGYRLGLMTAAAVSVAAALAVGSTGPPESAKPRAPL